MEEEEVEEEEEEEVEEEEVEEEEEEEVEEEEVEEEEGNHCHSALPELRTLTHLLYYACMPKTFHVVFYPFPVLATSCIYVNSHCCKLLSVQPYLAPLNSVVTLPHSLATR